MIYHQPGNSLGNFNYNAYTYTNTDYAPHFHKNMELLMVLEGTVSVTVDGLQRTLTAEQMALVLSHQIHSFALKPGAKLWVAVFSEDYVPFFAHEIKGKRGSDFVFTVSPAVKSLVLENLVDTDAPVLMKKACFYAVCDAYSHTVSFEPRPERSNFVVGKILDWISQNYTEDITLKQAADVFGYEYHYLSRLLNSGYRIRFVDLLNSYRVARTRELLQTTDLPVAEIMTLSGFQSIRSMNMVFKAQTGVTPVAYRNGVSD